MGARVAAARSQVPQAVSPLSCSRLPVFSMWHDTEWNQIDQCIVSWPEIMKEAYLRKSSALTLWTAIRGLFLDNADQRVVYGDQRALPRQQPFPR
jgi:hypothetical protein